MKKKRHVCPGEPGRNRLEVPGEGSCVLECVAVHRKAWLQIRRLRKTLERRLCKDLRSFFMDIKGLLHLLLPPEKPLKRKYLFLVFGMTSS